jgi:hypothetical protein
MEMAFEISNSYHPPLAPCAGDLRGQDLDPGSESGVTSLGDKTFLNSPALPLAPHSRGTNTSSVHGTQHTSGGLFELKELCKLTPICRSRNPVVVANEGSPVSTTSGDLPYLVHFFINSVSHFVL